MATQKERADLEAAQIAAAAVMQKLDGADGAEPYSTHNTASANVAIRDARALRLRLAGVPYPEIAAQLNFTTAKLAWDSVQRELRRRLVEPADQLRDLELMRLDRVQMVVWKVIVDPNSRFVDVDKAVKTFLQVSKRRADLLGLDAPKKIDISRQIREMAIAEGLDPEQAIKDAETVINSFDPSF